MSTPLHIMWFRQDLRLADNPALTAAAAGAARVLPVFILDDDNAEDWARGSASRWWLHHALAALDNSLSGHLILLRGRADEILPQLAAATGATAVCWNRCYEPWRIRRDTIVKERLKADGRRAESFGGSLLWEPWEVAKADGTPYRVFTPYYQRGCLGRPVPELPTGAPDVLELAAAGVASGLGLEDLGLLSPVGWQESLAPHWEISEAGGARRLEEFVTGGLHGYRDGRDFPATDHVSRLSPHLHHGTISPRQVWHAAGNGPDADHFRRELGWREFSHHLLYHFPHLPDSCFQPKFERFPWRWESEHLAAWQQGRTGVPLVDAGMRELWQTGFMHNRVRMIAASFLVKNLLVHWRLGAEWFWDTLVDADLANNSASWQWVAGSGADAAPYFRIFNPATQGRKFDPDGAYVRRWVPEIAALPDRWLHAPWEAPAGVLSAAGVALGRDYPRPVVDLGASRVRALEALGGMR